MSTKVKLVFLGQSGSNYTAQSATMHFNFPNGFLPDAGDFITLDGKMKLQVLSRNFEMKSDSLHEVTLTVKPESIA